MGGLKPIGSEKLQGMEKIHRIMEIARYKENIPNSINENQKNEYSLGLADGNTYHIVKERLGYIIKMGLNESAADYIEPMKNRKYFSSYSQALKKLNLMAKEFNVLYENVEGTSLFNEEKKKYKLKLGSSKKSTAPTSTDATGSLGVSTPTPAPAPITPAPITPAPEAMTPPVDMGMENKPSDLSTTPSPSGDLSSSETEEPIDDMSIDGGKNTELNFGDETDTEEEPTDDEEEPIDNEEEPTDDEDSKGGTSFKLIQKLTGKLAQKIRSYTEDNDIDSKDAKYILNSILSAIDTDSLEDEDVDDIIARLEGEDEENEDEGDDFSDDTVKDDMTFDEKPEDEEESDTEEKSKGGNKPMRYDEKIKNRLSKAPTKQIEPSMGELGETMSLSDAINKKVGIEYGSAIQDEFNEDMDEYTRRGARFQRKPRFYDDPRELEMFGESKVDKIISKYFDFSKKSEVSKPKLNLLEEKEKNRLKVINQVKNLSENIKQERTALKFLEKYPKSKFVGKTNKGNLIFDDNLIETKITINGTVI